MGMKSVVVKLLTMRLASQLVGSITAIGILVLTVYFFPRTILEYTWREEQSNYERATKNRIKFHEKIDAEAVKVDRLLPTNLTGKQLDSLVELYSVDTWNEDNSRAILMENMVLVDFGIAKYPTNSAYYISTVLACLAMIPSGIICGMFSNFDNYCLLNGDRIRTIRPAILFYCTGMDNPYSKTSVKYVRATITRDGIVFVIAIAGLVGVFSQMAAFAYLQSGKTWSLGTVLFWTGLQVIGARNMRNRKISLWLALVDFACYLNAASTIAFVIISGLRCWESREIIGVQQFTDDQVHKAIAVDKERNKECVKKPLFHN